MQWLTWHVRCAATAASSKAKAAAKPKTPKVCPRCLYGQCCVAQPACCAVKPLQLLEPLTPAGVQAKAPTKVAAKPNATPKATPKAGE